MVSALAMSSGTSGRTFLSATRSPLGSPYYTTWITSRQLKRPQDQWAEDHARHTGSTHDGKPLPNQAAHLESGKGPPGGADKTDRTRLGRFCQFCQFPE